MQERVLIFLPSLHSLKRIQNVSCALMPSRMEVEIPLARSRYSTISG